MFPYGSPLYPTQANRPDGQAARLPNCNYRPILEKLPGLTLLLIGLILFADHFNCESPAERMDSSSDIVEPPILKEDQCASDKNRGFYILISFIGASYFLFKLAQYWPRSSSEEQQGQPELPHVQPMP